MYFFEAEAETAGVVIMYRRAYINNTWGVETISRSLA
jgi:hypothetical protein